MGWIFQHHANNKYRTYVMRYTHTIDLAWYHLTAREIHHCIIFYYCHRHRTTINKPFHSSSAANKTNNYESPTHRPPVSNPSHLRHPQCRSLYKRWNQRRSDSSWCESERRGSREGLRLRWLEEDLPQKAGKVHLLPSAQPRAQRIHLLTFSARHLAKRTSPE